MEPQPALSQASNTASEIHIPAQSGNLPLIALNTLENRMNSIANSQMASTPFQPVPDGAARIEQGIAALLENLSGLELTPDQYDLSFLELGFDLPQPLSAQKIQATYGIKIAFRQLLDNLKLICLVAEHLLQQLPADRIAPPPSITGSSESGRSGGTENVSGLAAAGITIPPPELTSRPAGDGQIAAPMQQQLQAMAQLIQNQLHILGEAGNPAAFALKSNALAVTASAVAPLVASQPASAQGGSVKEISQSADERNALHRKPVHTGHVEMTPGQKNFLSQLIERYSKKTAGSKAFTQKHRRTLADPRVVSGFRREWKEMVYSIVSSRSTGSKLWDIDGNEYIDLLNGFGPTMFGHSPAFVTEAVTEQMKEGFAIGPQTPLAGRAADLLAEMTGAERVTFCNTGSEAVMAAMRLARTVTGRDRVVFFAGDYHGQFDEVLVKQLHRKGEFTVQPIAPGIPRRKHRQHNRARLRHRRIAAIYRAARKRACRNPD